MSLEKQGLLVAEALKKIVSEKSRQSYNELRVILAIERAVARLEREPKLAGHIIFKGGFVLLKTIDTLRFTRDLDAMVIGISKEEILSLVQTAIERDLDDGLWYGKVRVEELKHVPYPGIRFKIPFQIGAPPVSVSGLMKLTQIDIDIAFEPKSAVKIPRNQTLMPSILANLSPVSWFVYSPEYIFSEKLEALVSRGSTSSRAKDIYDLVQIFPRCKNKLTLLSAVSSTFEARETTISTSFYEEVSVFDLVVLKKAWVNVGKSTNGMKFEEIWALFLEILKQLDSF